MMALIDNKPAATSASGPPTNARPATKPARTQTRDTPSKPPAEKPAEAEVKPFITIDVLPAAAKAKIWVEDEPLHSLEIPRPPNPTTKQEFTVKAKGYLPTTDTVHGGSPDKVTDKLDVKPSPKVESKRKSRKHRDAKPKPKPKPKTAKHPERKPDKTKPRKPGDITNKR